MSGECLARMQNTGIAEAKHVTIPSEAAYVGSCVLASGYRAGMYACPAELCGFILAVGYNDRSQRQELAAPGSGEQKTCADGVVPKR